MEVDFMEAINGSVRTINFKVKDTCDICKGKKCKPGTQPSKCTTCKGTGFVSFRQGAM